VSHRIEETIADDVSKSQNTNRLIDRVASSRET